MRAGRGFAPRIRGIIEVPKPDQTFFTSVSLRPMFSRICSGCAPSAKIGPHHFAAEKINLIRLSRPQESLLDRAIRKKAVRVSICAHQQAIEIKPQAVDAHHPREMAPLVELERACGDKEAKIGAPSFAIPKASLFKLPITRTRARERSARMNAGG